MEQDQAAESLKINQTLSSDAIRISKPYLELEQSPEERDGFYDVRLTMSGSPIMGSDLSQAVRHYYANKAEDDNSYFSFSDKGKYLDSRDEFNYTVIAVRSAVARHAEQFGIELEP